MCTNGWSRTFIRLTTINVVQLKSCFSDFLCNQPIFLTKEGAASHRLCTLDLPVYILKTVYINVLCESKWILLCYENKICQFAYNQNWFIKKHIFHTFSIKDIIIIISYNYLVIEVLKFIKGYWNGWKKYTKNWTINYIFLPDWYNQIL